MRGQHWERPSKIIPLFSPTWKSNQGMEKALPLLRMPLLFFLQTVLSKGEVLSKISTLPSLIRNGSKKETSAIRGHSIYTSCSSSTEGGGSKPLLSPLCLSINFTSSEVKGLCGPLRNPSCWDKEVTSWEFLYWGTHVTIGASGIGCTGGFRNWPVGLLTVHGASFQPAWLTFDIPALCCWAGTASKPTPIMASRIVTNPLFKK